MLREVWSGGQSGADRAGWDAAKSVGLPTDGWMPRGFMTEDGPRPGFAALYCAREHPSPEYPPRTEANAAATDGTIWFGTGDSRGFGCTANACRRHGKPLLVVKAGVTTAADVAAWIREHGIERVNIAGNRASKDPELGAKVERFLVRVFRLVKADALPVEH